MKIRVDQFKGRIPRLASRSLPNEHAEVATNCRLKSTDLESWNGNALENEPTKVGAINAIYPLDMYGRYVAVAPDAAPAGPVWMHWTTSEGAARVARGFSRPPSDAARKERVYLAGLDVPRVTDIELAQDGIGTNFPLATYKLGVPAPTAKLEPAFAVVANPEIDAEYNCSDTFGWAGREALEEEDYVPAGSDGSRFQFVNLYNNPPSYLARDDGFGEAVYSKVRCTFQVLARLDEVPDSLSGWFYFWYLCNETGKGQYIAIRARTNGLAVAQPSYLYFGQSSDGFIPTIGQPLTTGTPTLSPATDYIFEYEREKTPLNGLAAQFNPGDAFSVKETVRIRDAAENELYSLVRTSFQRENESYFYAFGNASIKESTGGPAGHDTEVDDIELTLVGQSAQSGAAVTRYTYTFVNGFGEESAPGPLSELVPEDDELETTFSAIPDAAAQDITDYGIVGKRLYRAVTDDQGTVFRLVALRTDPIEDALIPNGEPPPDFVDDIATEDLSLVVLESQDWELPPQSAHDICALANGIMLLAQDNEVYPSVSFRPHAYVTPWALAADFPVVGIRAIENQAIALTEECPYLIRGDDPSAMSMDKISSVYGCASKYSIVRWKEYGVCYASFDGLIAVTAGGARNLTDLFFTREEWSALNPATMICEVYDEQMFVFHDTGTFIFDPNAGVVDLDFVATAVYLDPIQDRLFMAVGGDIVEFNAGSPLEATWRQGIRQLPYPMVFTAGQVRGPVPENFQQDVQFALYRNGAAMPYTSTPLLDSDTEFRLPGGAAAVAKEVQIELVTTGGRVNTAEIAEDMDELT